jgi:tetraacyldisaccharide 4'-kinase
MPHNWRATLAHHWLRWASHNGVWAHATQPMAAAYAWLARRAAHQQRQQRETLPVPVVVVGNVLVGGTGKTPIVAAVVQHLKAMGLTPGIIARGYKASGTASAATQSSQGQGPQLVDAHTPTARSGDEPKLLAQLTGVPVCVHPQRVWAAQYLLAQHPEVNVLVSDDGLQHAKLGRDVDIVVFDERGLGNQRLLPAGLLREPWPQRHTQGYKQGNEQVCTQGSNASLTHATRQPACLVVQNAVATPTVAPCDTGNPVFVSTRALGPLEPLMPWIPPPPSLRSTAGASSTPLTPPSPTPTGLPPQPGSPVQVLAGIAKPEVFASMLRAQGFDVVRIGQARDHDPLSGTWPASFGLRDDLPVICTAKDAVKLRERADAAQLASQVWVAPLLLQLPNAFWQALSAAMQTPRNKATAPK